MAEALYRKYRPQVFGDVVGQDHIERTIRNAIEHDKVSHAYLFTGPRGTGKTTTARLLAKALMCEKGPTPEPDGTCQDCQDIANGVHPDVYELDAASRTGVDNVREEIIGRVQFAPTRGRYKVYIIDEVHMLSTAAFNALLKTLEEPPSHVVFILCTTDPQKVPETIHSRCQRFDFHRISIESIVARLGAVCGQEGVEFEPEALELIAYRAEGGMRNALTSLEQLVAFGGDKVTVQMAERMLGSLDSDQLSSIADAIGRCDAAACFNLTAGLVEEGTDLAQFVRDFAEYVRNLYLMSLTSVEVDLGISRDARAVMEKQLKLFGPERLSNLLLVLGDLSKELRVSTNPRLSFEIALTRMVRPESDLTIQALAQRVEALERIIASGQIPAVSAGASIPTPSLQSAPARAAVPQPSSVPSSADQAVSGRGAALQSRQGAFAAEPQRPPIPRAQSAGSAPMPSAPRPTAPTQPQVAPAKPDQRAAVMGSAPRAATLEAPAVSVPAQPTMRAGSVVAGPEGTAAPAALDLSNPANLQRFWRSVTTALRKANPARGVLFMSAKVSVSAAGALRIGFTPENSFAFTAASKPEVVQLLAQTIEQAAGGHVPFELVMLDGSGAPTAPVSTPQAAAPVPRPAAPAPMPVVRSQSAPEAAASQNNPSAARAEDAARRAREAIRAAQAQLKNAPARSSASRSAAAASVPAYPAQGGVPARPQAQGTSAPAYSHDDDVPLDAYGSIADSYDEDADRPFEFEAPAAAAPVAQERPVPPSSLRASNPRAVADRPTAPRSDVSKAAPAAATAEDAAEVERLEKIFNDAFGGGVRFSDLG